MTSPPLPPVRRFLRDDTKQRVLVVEVSPGQGTPWLLFFTILPNGSVLERRRLAEFSPRWHELPDAKLIALHSAAVLVKLQSRTSLQRALEAAPGLSVAELAHELDAARRALEIAYLRLDSLALMLADRESELERARADAVTLNAEIQGLYRLANERLVDDSEARPEDRLTGDGRSTPAPARGRVATTRDVA